MSLNCRFREMRNLRIRKDERICHSIGDFAEPGPKDKRRLRTSSTAESVQNHSRRVFDAIESCEIVHNKIPAMHADK